MEPHKDLLSIFILAQPVGSRVIRQTKTVLWEPFLVRNLFMDVLNRTGQMSASPGTVNKPCPHKFFFLFLFSLSQEVDGTILELSNARMRQERP